MMRLHGVIFVLAVMMLLTAITSVGPAVANAQDQQQQEQTTDPLEIQDNAERWDFGLTPGYTQGILKVGGVDYAVRGFSNNFMLRWRRLPLYLSAEVGYLFAGSTVAGLLGYKRTHVLFGDPKFGVYRLMNIHEKWRVVPRIGAGITVFRPFLGLPVTAGRPGISTYGDFSLGGGVSLESRKPIWDFGHFKFNIKYNKIFVGPNVNVALGIPGTDSFGRHISIGAGFFWSIGEDPGKAKKERDEARNQLESTRLELTDLAQRTADPKISADVNQILQKVVSLEALIDEEPQNAALYQNEISAYRRQATEIHLAYVNDLNRRREEIANRAPIELTPTAATPDGPSSVTLVSGYLNAINTRSGIVDNQAFTPSVSSFVQKQLSVFSGLSKVRASVYKQRPDSYDIAISHSIDDTLSTRDIDYPWIQRVTMIDGKIDYINYVPDSTSYQNNVVDPFPSDPRTVELRDEVLYLLEPLRVSLEQGITDPLTDYLSNGVRVDMYELQGGMNRLQNTNSKAQFMAYMNDYLSRGNNLISFITIRAVNEKDIEVDMLFRQFDRGTIQRVLNRTSAQTDLLNEDLVVRKVIATFNMEKTGNDWTVTKAQWRARMVDFTDEAIWPKILNVVGK